MSNAITARIGFDSAAARAEMLRFKNSLKEMDKELGLLVTRGATAAGVAVIGIGTSASNTVYEMERLRANTGLTTDEFQDLINAARTQNVTIDRAADGIKDFSEKLGEARQGSGTLFEQLQRNNISLKDQDGNYRSVTDVLRDYVDAMGNQADASDRAFMAAEAFGGAGEELIKVFGQGSEALDRYTSEGNEKFGKFSEESIEDLQALRQQMSALKNQMEIGFADVYVSFQSEEGRQQLLDDTLETIGVIARNLNNTASKVGIYMLGELLKAFTNAVFSLQLGLERAAGGFGVVLFDKTKPVVEFLTNSITGIVEKIPKVGEGIAKGINDGVNLMLATYQAKFADIRKENAKSFEDQVEKLAAADIARIDAHTQALVDSIGTTAKITLDSVTQGGVELRNAGEEAGAALAKGGKDAAASINSANTGGGISPDSHSTDTDYEIAKRMANGESEEQARKNVESLKRQRANRTGRQDDADSAGGSGGKGLTGLVGLDTMTLIKLLTARGKSLRNEKGGFNTLEDREQGDRLAAITQKLQSEARAQRMREMGLTGRFTDSFGIPSEGRGLSLKTNGQEQVKALKSQGSDLKEIRRLLEDLKTATSSSSTNV